MSAEIHAGDVGFTFVVTLTNTDGTVRNLSAATTKEILLAAPDASFVAFAASFVTDGTDGKLRYSTLAPDLHVAGSWKIQAHVVTPSWAQHSQIAKFRVKPNVDGAV